MAEDTPSRAALPATLFHELPPGHEGDEKAVILEALARRSVWHNEIRAVVLDPRNMIKVRCTVSDDGTLLAAHLKIHNDFKLIKLAKHCAFPRGFCLVVDRSSGQLVGQGTFYPKFENDDRQSSFSAKDFGSVSRISCFIKYSGSTGIITILRDANGTVIGWTGSSKNSCTHSVGEIDRADSGIQSYSLETVKAFSGYVTSDFLQWCQRCNISSLGLEVMIDRDQTHGYGYVKTGCIVTSISTEGSADGRPVYLSPNELHRSCCEIGLPTDLPILVEGEANIQSFVQRLSDIRDILTLGALRHVLAAQGLDLQTMHSQLVDSEILEGFVIRRWRDDTEVESVKFKIWLYQMVTQVLRPGLSGGFSATAKIPSLKNSDGTLKRSFVRLSYEQMQRWCVVSEPATQTLCRWVIHSAARGSLPENHPQLQWSGPKDGEFPDASVPEGCVARDPIRAYWITLGDRAVKNLISLLDAAEWDVRAAVSNLKEDERTFDDYTSDGVADTDKGKGKPRKGKSKSKGKGKSKGYNSSGG